jgi:DNA-binding MarR family transcriptional regulator
MTAARIRAGGFVQQNRRKAIGARHLTIVPENADPRREQESRAAGANDGGVASLELGLNDLAALRRILISVEESEAGLGDPPLLSPEKRAAEIILEARKERARILPPSMFSEPAWDMLLALFIAGEVPAAADLARLAGTPATTAWRWVAYLEDHKLVERVSNFKDRRTHTIRLTGHARKELEALFSGVARKW